MSHHDPNDNPLGESPISGNRGSDAAIRRAHEKAQRAADPRDSQAQPTYDKPLNAKRRSPMVFVIVALVFVVAFALFYFFGLEVLVPAE